MFAESGLTDVEITDSVCPDGTSFKLRRFASVVFSYNLWVTYIVLWLFYGSKG